MATIHGVESLDDFLNSLSENGASQHTIRAYRADVTHALNWLEVKASSLTDLEGNIKRYLNFHRATWEPRTTRRKTSALRAWGKSLGISDFLAGYRPPKAPRAIPHPMPEGINGVMEMLDATRNDSERALVVLCGLLGCRVSEARSVRPRNFDPDLEWLHLVGKGDKSRSIPVTRTVRQLLRDLIDRTKTDSSLLVKLSDRGARDAITRIAKRAVLTRHVSSHDLRATLLTAAYQKSKDLRAVQELAGHSSSQTTEIYTGIREAAMRDAIEVI